MSEAALTLEGWYALHDFRSLDWTAWTAADDEERAVALDELNAFIEEWSGVEEAKLGSSAWYSIVGQKADFVMIYLRESLEELNKLEVAFNKTAFAPLQPKLTPMSALWSLAIIIRAERAEKTRCRIPISPPA